MKRYKAEAQKKTRLNAERRQREAQKREIEAQNRKHLAGLRVIQKNLVYVVGLNPRIKEEDLLQTLRGEQYFGQYGKIVKIVVNKRTAQDPGSTYHDNGKHSGGMGVYVTFARKQDAATCIAAVDGSVNGDRMLRFVSIRLLKDGVLLIEGLTGQHTGQPNTVLLTCEMKLVPIRTVCFFMNLERKRNPLVD